MQIKDFFELGCKYFTNCDQPIGYWCENLKAEISRLIPYGFFITIVNGMRPHFLLNLATEV